MFEYNYLGVDSINNVLSLLKCPENKVEKIQECTFLRIISNKSLYQRAHKRIEKGNVSCVFVSYWIAMTNFVCIDKNKPLEALSMSVDPKFILGEPKLFDDMLYIFGLPEKVNLMENNFYVRRFKFPTSNIFENENERNLLEK